MHRHQYIEEVVINLDNGPHSHSHRTQFIKGMVEFAINIGIKIRLVYYPPYHSKYNPIERCWGFLEKHWNGTLLTSVEEVIKWTETMPGRGSKPDVYLLNKIYENGKKLTKKIMRIYDNIIIRSAILPKWDVLIDPTIG